MKATDEVSKYINEPKGKLEFKKILSKLTCPLCSGKINESGNQIYCFNLKCDASMSGNKELIVEYDEEYYIEVLG